MKGYSAFLAAVILGLSINICYTDSAYLAFFDRAFIFVLFFTLFLTNLYDDSTWDTGRYTAAIVSVICTMPVFLHMPVSDALKAGKKKPNKDEEAQKERKNSNLKYILLGLVITLPILLVVLPLLALSDAVFSSLLLKIFDIELDLKLIRRLIGIPMMIIAIFFISYAFICRFSNRSEFLLRPVEDKRTKNPVIAITISTVLLAVYGLYCGIQVIYLFMGYGTLPSGYTYAGYVHEGFYQLVFVCIINLVLVLICRKYSQDNMILKVMLTLISACTFIMIFSSAYRMGLYIGAYGLTFLRLYVLWALAVIFLAMTGTCIYIYVPGMPFYKYSLVILTATWTVFALARPDYHIAKYNLTHDFARDDYYLIYHLSSDAAPAIDKYSDDRDLTKDYLKHILREKQEDDDRYRHSDNEYDNYNEPEMTLRSWNYSVYIMSRISQKYGLIRNS